MRKAAKVLEAALARAPASRSRRDLCAPALGRLGARAARARAAAGAASAPNHVESRLRGRARRARRAGFRRRARARSRRSPRRRPSAPPCMMAELEEVAARRRRPRARMDGARAAGAARSGVDRRRLRVRSLDADVAGHRPARCVRVGRAGRRLRRRGPPDRAATPRCRRHRPPPDAARAPAAGRAATEPSGDAADLVPEKDFARPRPRPRSAVAPSARAAARQPPGRARDPAGARARRPRPARAAARAAGGGRAGCSSGEVASSPALAGPCAAVRASKLRRVATSAGHGHGLRDPHPAHALCLRIRPLRAMSAAASRNSSAGRAHHS